MFPVIDISYKFDKEKPNMEIHQYKKVKENFT